MLETEKKPDARKIINERIAELECLMKFQKEMYGENWQYRNLRDLLTLNKEILLGDKLH